MVSIDNLNVQFAMKEGRRFYKMLMHYVDKAKFSTPVRILNVGCGQCLEAYALIDYFGKEPYGANSKNAEIIGIDLERRDLITAKEVSRNSEFIRADAKLLDKLFTSKFDVVITRHPVAFYEPYDWKIIYEKILYSLKPDGILIVTNYNQKEFEESKMIIQDLGYQVRVKEENPFSEETSIPSKLKDGWLIIAEKQ